MPRRGLLLLLAVVLLVGAALFLALSRISLSALDDPGRVETYLATRAKHWLIARSARRALPPAPPNNATSLANGRMLFGGECANCHGQDGRTPTDVGRALYPRTLDLGSPAVQEWSDAEVFWIIKHGIRLSGMPGFGRIHSDTQIWHLVHYVRSLRAQPK